jgi:PKD repeat protein
VTAHYSGSSTASASESVSPVQNVVTLDTATVNGQQVTINGSVNNSPTNLLWNWSDRQQTYGFFPQNHTYSAGGTYTVQVTAQYSNGSSISASEQVNPVQNVLTLYAATTNGLQATINGSVNNSPTNLVCNWGDGLQTTGFFPQSHTYSAGGTYTVQVTAQYSNGSTASSSENVTVTNPNTVTLYAATVSGLQATINGTVNNSPTNLVWNWGDGLQTTGFFPQSHTYSSGGTYTIQVTARYSNGSSALASESVTIVAHVVTLYAPTVSGLQVQINGVATPGALVTNISWNWGDGQKITGFFPQIHTYSATGIYTVQVTAYYNDGSTASATNLVSLVAHVVTLYAPSISGLQVQINGVATPGNLVTNITWEWGDGQQTSGFFPQTHTYAATGTYTVQVTAHYNDGSTAPASEAVATSPPTVSSTLSQLFITPSSASANGTSQITATVTLKDVNGNPVSAKAVTFYASEVNANNTPVTGSLSVNALVNPTDASGQATATITANTAGTVTIWAVDTTDSIVVQQTATAQFTPLAQVTPDSALSSAISDLDAASESNLGVLSTLAGDVGSSGDYFWEQSQLSGVNLASDIAFSVVDFSDIVPDNIGDQLASIYVENAAPSVVDTGLQVINELNSENNNDCSANNLFDNEWLTEMANNSLSPQAAAQGMLDHSQKLMAAMWLQEQGQNVSIGSLSDATVSSALTSLYNSSDGLTEVASALPGCVTSTLNQDLSTRKSSLLSGIPPMSTAQQTAWSNDLAARQGVPLIYYNIISQYQQYLATMTSLSESAQFGENAATLLQTFAGGWALVLDTASGNDSASVFVDSADDAVNTFADNARLNSYEQMYSTAFNTLEQCFDYNGRI